MKVRFFAVLAAAVVASFPVSGGALAANNPEYVPQATSIGIESTKSPNYQFSFQSGAVKTYYGSPEFYHTGGHILVTLVQWDPGLGSPDLDWSVITPFYPSIVHGGPVNITNEYTSSSYTIDFGNIPAGRYQIYVNNNDGDEAEGNFFVYYN